MPAEVRPEALAREIESALDLLSEFRSDPGDVLTEILLPEERLPGLLAQCESLCAETAGPPVIRTIHHFACTGGTLISKVLAALPGSVLLSEIDPLSRMGLAPPGKRPAFAPSDLLYGLKHSVRELPDEVLISTFLAAVTAMQTSLSAEGYRLILRDHAHSQFCTRIDPASRPDLGAILARSFTLRSVVTLRHPLESFLSLQRAGWRHFTPFTLEEYCRRYRLFLGHYRDLPLVRYEDFVTEPEQGLRQLCDLLDLPFSPLALDLSGIVRISGDSGRGGGRIEPRPPKPVPADLAAELQSDAYRALCAEYGYDPDQNPLESQPSPPA